MPEEHYHHLDEYATYPGYSDRQRLAIEYAERFAADHRNIDDELFTRLRAHFADDEILDLTLCCAVFVGLGRTLEVLQITDNCRVGRVASTLSVAKAALCRAIDLASARETHS